MNNSINEILEEILLDFFPQQDFQQRASSANTTDRFCR